MRMHSMKPRPLTLQQAADHLNMSYQWIRREISYGNLTAIKLGRYYRVEQSELEAYMKRNRTTEA